MLIQPFMDALSLLDVGVRSDVGQVFQVWLCAGKTQVLLECKFLQCRVTVCPANFTHWATLKLLLMVSSALRHLCRKALQKLVFIGAAYQYVNHQFVTQKKVPR